MQRKTISPYKTLRLGKSLFSLEHPVVMGILNITSDSFYEGSRTPDENTWLNQAQQMLQEGAFILDVGGYSTRPGAAVVPEEEEKLRLLPAIHSLKKHFPQAILSADTFRASVAQAAIDAGADVINDTSGGQDENMVKVIAQTPYICMHTKGTPQTMQGMASYTDVTQEVLTFFYQKIRNLLRQGIADIIIDPGFGFAKTTEQNFTLLKNIDKFRVLKCPILVGISRKSMIWKTLNLSPDEALNGSSVLQTVALLKGVDIIRTHDVKECVEAIQLVEKLR